MACLAPVGAGHLGPARAPRRGAERGPPRDRGVGPRQSIARFVSYTEGVSLVENLAEPAETEQLLRESLDGARFGAIEVRGLSANLGEDADGQTAVYVDLVLSDPEGETWALEDSLALKRKARELLRENRPGLLFYLALRPENEELQAEEDD